MSLEDKGYRFMVSPDRVDARWCHPLEIERFYPDWIDCTDTPEKEFIEFLELSVDSDGAVL